MPRKLIHIFSHAKNQPWKNASHEAQSDPQNLLVQETFGLQIHIQPNIQFMQALPYVHISLFKLPEAYSYRFNNLHNYSGRKLTRFGRSVI